MNYVQNFAKATSPKPYGYYIGKYGNIVTVNAPQTAAEIRQQTKK